MFACRCPACFRLSVVLVGTRAGYVCRICAEQGEPCDTYTLDGYTIRRMAAPCLPDMKPIEVSPCLSNVSTKP
jgi:hypothetical protein